MDHTQDHDDIAKRAEDDAPESNLGEFDVSQLPEEEVEKDANPV